MRRYALVLLVGGSSILLTLAGCPAPGGTPTLTDGQKDAAAKVVTQLAAADATLSAIRDLADDALDPANIGQIGSFGTCPVVTFVANAQAIALQFDFGSGCEIVTGHTVSGSISITIPLPLGEADFQFVNFTVDGHSVTGSLQFTIARVLGGVTLTGSAQIVTAGVGAFSGAIAVSINADGTITLAGNDVTVTADQNYLIGISSVVVDPVNNGNFIPESGTVAFTMLNDGPGPDTVDVTITFTAITPVDGTVLVKVGSAAAVPYQIPGLIE